MGFSKLLLSIYICSTLLYGTIPNEPIHVSNYPESVSAAQTIFNEYFDLSKNRIHYYHYNASPFPLKKTLTISNPTDVPIELAIQHHECMGTDGSKCAFQNSLEFWTHALNNQQTTIRIDPFSSISLTDTTPLNRMSVHHGILRILNATNTVYRVELGYDYAATHPRTTNQLTMVPFESNTIISKEIIPYNGKYVVSIGEKNTRTYAYNRGNYGQIHEIHLLFENPYPHALSSSIYYNRVGGMARNTLVIDGNIHQTTRVLFSNTPETIATFVIPPKSSKTHVIALFPESGNFYPIEIVVDTLKDVFHDA